MAGRDVWQDQQEALGAWLRSQRRMANLTLRQMAELAQVSNPYLSQIERGLHQPSVRVLQSIARALDMSAETVLEQAGVLEGAQTEPGADRMPRTERAIRTDPLLTSAQQEALISVYRSYVSQAAPVPDEAGA